MSLRIPLILTVVTVLIAGGGGVLYEAATSSQSEASVPVAVSTPASHAVLSVSEAADRMNGFSLLEDPPLIPAVKMTDEAGVESTLQAYRGKVVLLNLWATWCPPCIREMPDLNALQKEFVGQDFVVVPVASGRQGREDAAEFLRARKLNALKTYYDPHSSYLSVFGLESLPTTFLIDRTGKMRGGVLGMADWHTDEAKALIEAFLNEKS